MVELLFCVALLAGVIALGMYKAPLWVWAGALAVAALVWHGEAVHGTRGLVRLSAVAVRHRLCRLCHPRRSAARR